MAARINEIIEDAVAQLDVDNVQLKYIILARVVDFEGREHVLEGDELEAVLRGPKRQPYRSVQLVLDLRSIKIAMQTEIVKIFNALDARLAEDHNK